MDCQLLNLREVRRRLPRSRSTLYDEIKKGIFPKPIKAGRGSFWRDDEIEDLIGAYSVSASGADLKSLCSRFYERRRGRQESPT